MHGPFAELRVRDEPGQRASAWCKGGEAVAPSRFRPKPEAGQSTIAAEPKPRGSWNCATLIASQRSGWAFLCSGATYPLSWKERQCLPVQSGESHTVPKPSPLAKSKATTSSWATQ
jgi:hypothetical protein